MKRLKKMAATAALLSLPGQALADCMTHEEAEAVATAFLPVLVTNVHGQCRPLLPEDAPLSARGLNAAERYSGPALRARDIATPIAARMILSGETPPSVEEFDPSLALDALEMALAVQLAGELDADDCQLANSVFTALEPLPAENFARLFVVFLDIGSRNDEAPGPFGLCRDEG